MPVGSRTWRKPVALITFAQQPSEPRASEITRASAVTVTRVRGLTAAEVCQTV
jgi:hypothetical protein